MISKTPLPTSPNIDSKTIIIKPYVPFVIRSNISQKSQGVISEFTKRKNINSTSQILNQQVVEEEQSFSFQILEGNNSDLVRRVMKKRAWWKEAEANSFADFVWQPVSNGYKYERFNMDEGKTCRQLFNHLEYHREITNKAYLLKNLKEFSQVICSEKK